MVTLLCFRARLYGLWVLLHNHTVWCRPAKAGTKVWGHRLLHAEAPGEPGFKGPLKFISFQPLGHPTFRTRSSLPPSTPLETTRTSSPTSTSSSTWSPWKRKRRRRKSAQQKLLWVWRGPAQRGQSRWRAPVQFGQGPWRGPARQLTSSAVCRRRVTHPVI